MGLLEKRTGDKVHSRTLEIFTYQMGDRGIIVTGELIEKRLQPCYGISGKIQEPHTVHHMIIRMLIEGLTFTITEIEVEIVCLQMVLDRSDQKLRESFRVHINLSCLFSKPESTLLLPS